MNYNILHIAYPLALVHNNAAGGAEQILYMIDKGLAANKINSSIIACVGSAPVGRLITLENISGTFDDDKIAQIHIRLRDLIEKVLTADKYDIIHMHGIDFNSYLPVTELPILVTLHLPIQWYNHDILVSDNPNVFYNCVSESQQQTAGEVRNLLPFIQNGIDLQSYKAGFKKENFVLSLGRICWEKGYNLSIMAARMSGTELILAGKVYPYYHHEKYFKESIEPSLNDRDIKFIDSPDYKTKKKLLASARCVLIPSLVPETSSLVAMEALASGTPVIAFSSGALSEIIKNGITGFIVNNTEEMAEAINHVHEIDPAECRRIAEERFDYKRMSDEYINAYTMILNKEVKHPSGSLK